MRWLDDSTLQHLRQVAELPDLSATRYDILEVLGRGGMGTVYRARDRELGREVALKVLSVPDLTPALGRRMLQEARILARLEHPGIVPIHDVGTLPDGRVFYVMKRVRGSRLDEHVRRELPLQGRLRLFEKVCEAVAFAHAHGVVHRDLKPENVMVGSFGEVLVLDWGVAKVLSREPAATQPEPPEVGAPGRRPAGADTATGAILGTPGYMAPEQARGEIDRIDHRADIYSLGAILWFLVCGQPPQPAAVSSSAGSGSRALQAVCRKALAAEPAERYASVQELAAEVGRFLSALPVQAHRESLFERLRRLAVKYRVAILLILSYLLMRVLLIVATGR